MINISPGLKWHLKTQTPLSEPIYRYASPGWASLLREARALYQGGLITEIDEDDFFLLESDAGETASFEDRTILLDTPEPNWERPGWSVVYVRDRKEVKRLDIPTEDVTL